MSRFLKISLILAALWIRVTHAQSEASVAASVGGISEAGATLIGGALGAGAGLVVGTVSIVGEASLLTIVTGASAAGEASEATLQVPHAIAAFLAQRRGEKIDSDVTPHGTRLTCQGKEIAFIPNATATASAPREAL
jgi:hypothetical protein